MTSRGGISIITWLILTNCARGFFTLNKRCLLKIVIQFRFKFGYFVFIRFEDREFYFDIRDLSIRLPVRDFKRALSSQQTRCREDDFCLKSRPLDNEFASKSEHALEISSLYSDLKVSNWFWKNVTSVLNSIDCSLLKFTSTCLFFSFPLYYEARDWDTGPSCSITQG